MTLTITLSQVLQRELDDFYKKVLSADYFIRQASKSAFPEARVERNPWAYERLNELAVKSFIETAHCCLWHQMRLLVVDGTQLVLPNHKTTKEEFGVQKFWPNADHPRSMATASMLSNVLKPITPDAQIESYSTSEEETYKQPKSRIELAPFSGKTAWSVRQDFNAKIPIMTPCAIFPHPIEEKVRQDHQADESRQYSQKNNSTRALAMTRGILKPLFRKRRFDQAGKAIDQSAYNTREIIRPDRPVPRNKPQKVPYTLNYNFLNYIANHITFDYK